MPAAGFYRKIRSETSEGCRLTAAPRTFSGASPQTSHEPNKHESIVQHRHILSLARKRVFAHRPNPLPHTSNARYHNILSDLKAVQINHFRLRHGEVELSN